MRVDNALIWIHVTANLFWIGSIVAVALVMLSDKGEAKLRGQLARHLYVRLATPSFVLSLLCGMGRLLMDAPNYMKSPWMHGKLTVVLVVIALHHVIGGRARRLAEGDIEDGGKVRIPLYLLATCAVLAVFFVVMRIPGG